MQLQKRLDYGFNGYQVPSIPRAARSARKKGPVRKKTEDKQVCAFDVLATVAGKILIDGELAHTSINTSDGNDHCKGGHDVIDKKQIHGPIKAQPCDHGSSGIVSLPPAPQSSFKEKSHSRHDDCSVIASVITSSECLEKGESHQNSVGNDDKNEFSSHLTKLEGHPYGIMEVSGPNLEDHVNEEMQSQTIRTGTDMFYSEDPDFLDRKPLLVTSDTMKASLDKDECPRGSHSLCRDHVNLVSRDDDENSSNCNQPSSKIKSPMCIGDQRIMELSASKHWRAAPRLKDGDLSDTGAETQSVYCSRNNNGYKRQRSQRIYPLKKRKLFRCSSASHSDDVLSCNAMYKTPEKDIDATASGFGAMRHAGNGTTSSVSSDNTSFHSGESHVKVRIKSFQVPELFIEMPQTATIGSLKMTVMEALTTLLGGGLRVGVLLQGKKIRDDNTTLLQSGVCHGNKVESLGFTLEPKSSSARSPAFSKDQSLLLSSDIPVPLSKSAPPPVQSMIHQQPSHPSPDLPLSNMGNFIESDHDSVQSTAEISKEKSKLDSRALVTVPEGTPQALAVVPVLQKSKRSSEMAQRRIRRPFSVSEVEALLEAVEKLGTGRWRDVKMRAFDNVKYRTYVDLKDKWKTLVHTARISPQQRRGEPVPQELLDRVMTAHAYWSHQQSKHQLGHQSESLHL